MGQVIRDQVPGVMRNAWHVDVHQGRLARLLEPHELVGAAFGIRLSALAAGNDVETIFGAFHADEVISEPDRSFALLHIGAPGSLSRFALQSRRDSEGACKVELFNSVHPTVWLGKVYFRAIQIGHNIVMHVALRRLARASRRDKTL